MKLVGSVLAIIMLLGAFFGVYRFIDTRYALSEELKKDRAYVEQIEKRLDFKIADDKRVSFQKEMREIEERNLGKPIDKWDQRDRKRYNELKDQLVGVIGKIEKMI